MQVGEKSAPHSESVLRLREAMLAATEGGNGQYKTNTKQTLKIKHPKIQHQTPIMFHKVKMDRLLRKF